MRTALKVIRLAPAGLNTNANAHLIRPGEAQEQINLRSDIPGRWTCRNGMRPVVFANAGSTNSGQAIIAGIVYRRPETTWVISQLANGSLLASRGLS